MQHSYSRALDVAYGGSSGSGSGNSVNQSQAETNDQDGDAASTEKTVELVKNGASVSLSEISAYHMIQTCLYLKIQLSNVLSTGALSLI